MSKNLFIAILIIFSVAFACSFNNMKCIEGEGKVVEQTISLTEFDKIQLKNSVNLILQEGKTLSVTIKGQQNLIDLLNTTIKDDTWEIMFTECVRKMDKFEVYLTIPELDEISLLGSGNITSADGVFKTKSLEVKILGSGDINLALETNQLEGVIKGSGNLNLSGSTDKCDLKILGSGNINALKLESKSANTSIKGSGDIRVAVEEELEIEIKGSGNVSYKGSPNKIDQEIKGSGEVKKLN